MESRRSLTAILFTDIVDSTRRAAELGDRAVRVWPVLESAQKRVAGSRENAWIRWWLSELAIEVGRPEDAIRYLESVRGFFGTGALYQLARAYEDAGRRDDARYTYELLLTAWSEADPEQAPRVAEVRQRLAGLGMAPRG